ncbi:hypothetical protein STCU_06533 [Strigomonas culicis]|uniref:Uncharacterized protein n=1 Tax=Strigomonas culicis TaxID=28005 RepID=S9VRA1_9TRYP|nr:hypothetical protein STCU_06533 [Strigomonas culicis]|eukprot:EPY25710.1 hypothetical protein STCU_06533 [Strigomonas culicis]
MARRRPPPPAARPAPRRPRAGRRRRPAAARRPCRRPRGHVARVLAGRAAPQPQHVALGRVGCGDRGAPHPADEVHRRHDEPRHLARVPAQHELPRLAQLVRRARVGVAHVGVARGHVVGRAGRPLRRPPAAAAQHVLADVHVDRRRVVQLEWVRYRDHRRAAALVQVQTQVRGELQIQQRVRRAQEECVPLAVLLEGDPEVKVAGGPRAAAAPCVVVRARVHIVARDAVRRGVAGHVAVAGHREVRQQIAARGHRVAAHVEVARAGAGALLKRYKVLRDARPQVAHRPVLGERRLRTAALARVAVAGAEPLRQDKNVAALPAPAAADWIAAQCQLLEIALAERELTQRRRAGRRRRCVRSSFRGHDNKKMFPYLEY